MLKVRIDEMSRSVSVQWQFDSEYAARRWLKAQGAMLAVKRYEVTDLYGQHWAHREYIKNDTRYLLRVTHNYRTI
jgi:hypothetical protein